MNFNPKHKIFVSILVMVGLAAIVTYIITREKPNNLPKTDNNQNNNTANYVDSSIPLKFSYPKSLNIQRESDGSWVNVGSGIIEIYRKNRNKVAEETNLFENQGPESEGGVPPLVSLVQFDADKNLINSNSAGSVVECPKSINSMLSYWPLKCEIATIDSRPAMKRYYNVSPWDFQTALQYTLYIGDNRVDIMLGGRAKDLNDYIQKRELGNDTAMKQSSDIFQTLRLSN